MERYFNLYTTTVASGGYTAGSGVLNVAATSPVSLNAGDTCALLVYRVIAGVITPIVLLKATAVNSSTQFAAVAEGSDANALINDVVINVNSVRSMTQIMQDWLYGDLIKPPTTSIFGTSVNDSHASSISFTQDTTSAEQGVILSAASSGADTAIVARLMAVPTAPYKFRMRFRVNAQLNSYPLNGFCWYDSVSGKFAVFGTMGRNDYSTRIRYTTYSNSNTYNGTSDLEIQAVAGWPGRNGLYDIYCQDDGTNRKCSYISTGILADAALYRSVSNTDYLTPTHVGIFIAPGNNNTQTFRSLMKVIDWTQS